MDIHRNNYEAWLLDLMEGSLSAEEIRELRNFILLNPDCAVGTELDEPWMLEAEEVFFPGKAALHKVIPDHNSKFSENDFDLFSIAMLEGDLSVAQEEEYLQVIEGDDEKFREWLLWKKMRLEEDSIFYEHKGQLKKKKAPRFSLVWISIASAAAVIFIFFSLFRFDRDFKPGNQIALETEANLENPVIEKAIESPEIKPLSEELSAVKPLPLTGEEKKFSIKEQRDQPENTGQSTDADQGHIQEAVLQERPLKLAMLQRSPTNPSLQVNFDKIEALELPAIKSYQDPWAGEQNPVDGLRQSYQEFVEKKNISLLSIASAGVEGINRLAGSELSLDVARDQKGEVKGFRFRSALISVDTPVKKQNISR